MLRVTISLTSYHGVLKVGLYSSHKNRSRVSKLKINNGLCLKAALFCRFRDCERIQNTGNLPYNCFWYFLKKWWVLYVFISMS